MENVESNVRYIEEIPPSYRSVFQEYPCFNTVQATVLDDALQTDNPLVVSAPTGSGKTAIFEMAIVRLLMVNERTDFLSNTKIIYISPIKALCRERLIDWHKKFSEFGIKCISLTSDTNDIDVRNICQYNLIISTPEKWDVVTRRWRDNQTLVASIKLFMIDEVHLLNADSRGSTLEVIVSRMKTAEEFLTLNQDKRRIRFIALSATIPNVDDIAEWIGRSGTAKYFKFSEDVRPVKLDKVVYGFNATTKSSFKFDLSLNYKLPKLIYQYSKGKPTLIFCSTRKIVEMTTSHLVTNLQIRLSQEQKEVLAKISGQINDTKLRQFIVHGIALHHAGLVPENRNIIESSFREGNLPILVTTSTLAMGVNLPAHLVIVKGTKCYSANEGFKDYDEVSIFQMIGRAGRSQFDTSATALILTSIQDKKKYEQMLNCTQNIESNLHKHLTEHLNAEIVLKTITDLDVAMNWLTSTFLYVRARKCPEKYKFPAGLSKEKIDKKLLQLCQIDLNRLVRAGMIKMNQAIEVTPTVVGEIMAKYYIAFDTMELFTKVSGDEIIIQILALLSKCYEFSEIYLRINDKKCLNLLNKNAYKESIRFPLAGKIKTVDMKINCIMQAVLGNLDIPDQSVLNDSTRVMRSCERLTKCLIEYLETRTKCYTALLNTTILAKCFQVKLWENSPYVSKQLTGVGHVLSTLLVKAGKTTFKEIINTNPRHIEMVIGRKAPFGSTIVDQALHLPEYQMSLQKCNKNVNLAINLLNSCNVEENPTIKLSSKMTLLVGDSDNNILLYEKYAHTYMLDHPELTRSINIENQNIAFVTADLISEDWVGIDCHFKLEISPKPTPVTTPSTNTNQTKNSKQTYIDMYMQTVKKANKIKKVKSISNKNTPTNIKNRSISTGIQDKINSKEKKNTCKVNIKNKDADMIGHDKNSKMIDSGICNNNDDVFRSISNINGNCLELTEPHKNGTSEVDQNIQNVVKKTENSKKKKKILVGKSIFRMKNTSKNMETTENKSQFNTSIKKRISQKSEKIVKPQRDQERYVGNDNSEANQKITPTIGGGLLEAVFSPENPLEKNETFLEYHKLQDCRDPNNIDMVVKENFFPKKSEITNLKRNNFFSNDCKLNTTTENGIERTISDDFFPSESLLNAAMDDFELNKDILENRALGSSHKEEYRISDDTNILKNLNIYTSNKSNIDKSRALNRHISRERLNNQTGIVDNTVRNGNSSINNNIGNNNHGWIDSLDEHCTLPSRMNLNTYIGNLGYSGSNNLKNSVNTIVSENLNRTYDDDCGNKNKSKDITFHTDIFPKCDDNKKKYPSNKAPSFINNTCLTKLNYNDELIQPSQEHNRFEKEKRFPEKICNSKIYAVLNGKYNSKIQSNSGPNYNEKQKISSENDKNIDKNREHDMKVAMDYPECISNQNFFQREKLLTPRSKRWREPEDLSSPIEGSQAKRIKWRSPLVHSPPQFFTPHTKSPAGRRTFCFEFGDAGSSGKEDTKESNDVCLGSHDTSSSSTNLSVHSQKPFNLPSSHASTRKKLAFPLCDQDYIKKDDSFENMKYPKYLEDIVDLEEFGLVNKKANSKNDTAKNVLGTPFSGEYYSKLLNFQPKNLEKDCEREEKDRENEGKPEIRNGFVPYEPVYKSTLTSSQKLPQSPIASENFLDPNTLMSNSRMYHTPKSPRTNIYTQGIPYEQKCNLQPCNRQLPNESNSNSHYIHFGQNINYGEDNMNAVHQDIHLQRIPVNDDSTQNSFVNLPKSQGELHQRHLSNFHSDNNRFTLPSRTYLGYHGQPVPSEMIYQHQEMPSPYPINFRFRYPSSMGIGYPIPMYENIDPYVHESYPSLKIEPNWIPMKHISNTNRRPTPTYYSQMGAAPETYVHQYSQQSQELGRKSLHFENNREQENPVNDFKPTSSFERKTTGIGNNSDQPSNVFFESKIREQENLEPQLSEHNRNKFRVGKECYRSTIVQNQSQSDNAVHPSISNADNNQKFMGSGNINKLFSPMPKRQLQHSRSLNMAQNHNFSLPQTPYRHLVTPTSQGRLLNINSFEERLDNVISLRNHGFILPTREQQYDPRRNCNTDSYQSNDREYVMNRFLPSNGRN